MNKEEKAAYNSRYWKENKDRILEARKKGKYREKSLVYFKNRRLENKVKALAILDCRCSKCGFDEPGALHFHHTDPSTKEFEIMKLLSSCRKIDWDRVKQEISKCVLLCANCHLLEHCSWVTKDVYRETLSRTDIRSRAPCK